MTIPTISTLPTAPARTDAPATFITRADAFLAAIVTMQSELNTSIGAMNTDIAGVNTDATAAAASASAAATSESNASTSESNAATSETNAASSAAAAASSYDQFDDRYLGSKASDPAVDNDGNALLTGALYFNTTSDDMKVYTGTTWKVTGFNPDSPTFTDTVTAPSFDINSIAETKAETAVDVFVYDTRKDSDGGAWRKRTQHTSWYNETLDTGIRGSRREFPAVAVILATGSRVQIYDGDDPALSMWMEFTSGGPFQGSGSNIRCVSMLNGILVGGSSGGLGYIDFIKERLGRVHSANTGNTGLFPINVAERTTNTNGLGTYWGYNIVDFEVNDVAMTVLPNAPIDAATGLPVPTIAVATEGGVSVIKDDGTVVDSSATTNFARINFSNDGDMWATDKAFADEIRYYGSVTQLSDNFAHNLTYWGGSTSSSQQGLPVPWWDGSSSVHTFISATDYGIAAQQSGEGVFLLNPKYTDRFGLGAYVTSTYNTGWMNGDIKLATLSDTDDTDIGTQEVTNGTFNTDLTGWTNSGSHWAVSSGRAYHSASSTFYTLFQALPSLVTGKQYTIKFDYEVIQGELRAQSRTSANDPATDFTLEITGTGTETLIFTKSADMGGIAFARNIVGETSEFYIDNVSIVEAVEDRSVNDNGLQVFGTITKNPVATGADLVAYSGFSSSNYLLQPYNSDLDVDTGDYTCIAWMKKDTLSAYQDIFDFADGSSTNRLEWLIISDGRPAVFINGTPTYGATGSFTTGVWNCVAMTRIGGVVTHYINGENVGSGTNSGNIGNANCKLYVGINYAKGNANGSLSLLRISQTAATAEQIAKIYEDEKFLFQDNAQATLYGTSDAVTALAYDGDTELLHVGTSAGRSVFQGLRRVDNTTGAVGAAISASNGLVAED